MYEGRLLNEFLERKLHVFENGILDFTGFFAGFWKAGKKARRFKPNTLFFPHVLTQDISSKLAFFEESQACLYR